GTGPGLSSSAASALSMSSAVGASNSADGTDRTAPVAVRGREKMPEGRGGGDTVLGDAPTVPAEVEEGEGLSPGAPGVAFAAPASAVAPVGENTPDGRRTAIPAPPLL